VVAGSAVALVGVAAVLLRNPRFRRLRQGDGKPP